jgi:hypothetical protein
MRQAMQDNKIFMWGSLHEAMPFMMIIMITMQEAP